MIKELIRDLSDDRIAKTASVQILISVVNNYIKEFNKLGDDCKYDWTIEEIADTRLHVAKYIVELLKMIKKANKKAYEAVRIVYFDELKQVLTEIKQHR